MNKESKTDWTPSKVIHFILRLLIFSLSLLISTAVLLYFLSKMPNNPSMQAWAKLAALVFEGGMAYVLSKALGHLLRHEVWTDYLIGGILLLCYGAYIYVAIQSAQMLFMAELNQKSTIETKQTETHDNYSDLYKAAKADSERFGRLMDVEEKSGAKSIYDKWQKKKQKADDDMKTYASLMNTQNQVSATIQNIQADFQKLYPNDWAERMKRIFLILMGSIYLFQVLTTWPLPLPSLLKETAKNETVTDNSDNVTPYPYRVTPFVTEVTKPEKCACGCGNPALPGSMYFSNACKTKRCRSLKREAEGEGT